MVVRSGKTERACCLMAPSRALSGEDHTLFRWLARGRLLIAIIFLGAVSFFLYFVFGYRTSKALAEALCRTC